MSSIIAPANFEQLEFREQASTGGVTAFFSAKTIETIRRNGGGEITFRFEPEEANEDQWLTLKEAGVLYLEDRPHLSSLDSAKSIISKECKRMSFKTHGSGRSLRIDPGTFAVWRLKKRDELLDEYEAKD